MIEASLHQSLILKSFRLPSDYSESPHLSVLDILNEKNDGDIRYKEQHESIRIPIRVEGPSHSGEKDLGHHGSLSDFSSVLNLR